jgi:hypothetical protein
MIPHTKQVIPHIQNRQAGREHDRAAHDQAHPMRVEYFVHVRIELYALPACGQTRAAP